MSAGAKRSVRGGAKSAAPRTTNDLLPAHHPDTYATRKVVGLFAECFRYILASDELPKMVQLVKGDLFNRDYLQAFNSEDKRLAYVVRWVPARALAYSSLFASLKDVLGMFRDPNESRRVLCVGGGASSEVVGLASLFCGIKLLDGSSKSLLHVDVVDIADWGTIVGKITLYVQQKWLHDGTAFSSSFKCREVLTMSAQDLMLAEQDLVTLLFTTNELFREKKTDTIRFFQRLCSKCRAGSFLLIAESAGSYSNITVGLKQFPVQFLIDVILVGKPGENNGTWEDVQLSESCWYRVDEREVEYPVKLESMRFFYRLYRKR